MQAAFMRNLNDIILKDVKLEELLPNEIRIKVDACGICGTDVTSARDGNSDYTQFGHEVAGTVLEIGNTVDNVSVGHKVVLESSSACGKCSSCRNRQQDLCLKTISFWPRKRLGFAEEMLSPCQCAVPYENLTPEEACLSEPLGVALDLCKTADLRPGNIVLVSGLGTIGLMAIKLARISGASKIYACGLSKSKKRLEIARQFGADEVIAVDKTPLTGMKFSQNPDRFLITSPPQTLPDMIEMAAPKAIISYIGIKYGEGSKITFDANIFHFKKLELRGSFAAPAMCTPLALDLLKKSISGKSLISHILKLNEIGKAMQVAALDSENVVKVIVKQ
jgi:L-iditol 2-dehydrogenase